MKYLIVTKRHSSSYGENFVLFWGQGASSAGYTSDVAWAHRFSEDELPKKVLESGNDIAVECSVLGVTDEQRSLDKINCNYIRLMEKAKFCELTGNSIWVMG